MLTQWMGIFCMCVGNAARGIMLPVTEREGLLHLWQAEKDYPATDMARGIRGPLIQGEVLICICKATRGLQVQSEEGFSMCMTQRGFNLAAFQLPEIGKEFQGDARQLGTVEVGTGQHFIFQFLHITTFPPDLYHLPLASFLSIYASPFFSIVKTNLCTFPWITVCRCYFRGHECNSVVFHSFSHLHLEYCVLFWSPYFRKDTLELLAVREESDQND